MALERKESSKTKTDFRRVRPFWVVFTVQAKTGLSKKETKSTKTEIHVECALRFFF